ncbi:SDR family NAD(P)-dependent oxidoreductase [Amycolatopsis echigonensis]|uniref:SDR family NAD(P)-dependent oxidoreductase n=1 Tax=Amycolatopsis echigonensis TaxID=2576905 RepID=A0A8E1VV00_9PSEU|nr:SDR family NAD(P)-dependent oxidoreductase [Amycolatopsis echigonensis]MBB2498711.1 SDR family NAD(P)-dependent oxidoreductase [Amycolatopsis echigonensis]
MGRRIWLLTGASGGLGTALTRAASTAGDEVVAISREDLSDPARVRRVVAEAVTAFGRIDVVVNNAGYAAAGAFEELSDSAIREQFEVNFFAAAEVVRATLPYLRAARSGHIVQISSLAGQIGAPGMSAYTASKHALEGLSVSLAEELAPFGIRVGIVEPGALNTGFRQSWAGRERPGAIADYDDLAARLDLLGHDTHRPTEPEDVADAIVALVGLPEPPLRLAVGSDAAAGIRAARTRQLTDLETRWIA